MPQQLDAFIFTFYLTHHFTQLLKAIAYVKNDLFLSVAGNYCSTRTYSGPDVKLNGPGAMSIVDPFHPNWT